MHANYQISFFWKLQNLKQKESSVTEYTEELYKLSIRSVYSKDEIE